MKYDQDLCLNFDLKKLLWQDELNPRVRCAFGNVLDSEAAMLSKQTRLEGEMVCCIHQKDLRRRREEGRTTRTP